jgi:Tol biopolymer transport system component
MKIPTSLCERKLAIILVAIAVSLFGLGCEFLSGTSSDPTEAPSAPTEAPVTQPVPPTHEPIPLEPDPTQGEDPTPERPLGMGPWLLIAAEDGVWAVNADGSGLTQLTHEIPLSSQDLDRSVASQGGHVALITSSDPSRMANLTLRLLSLHTGNFEMITPLTSAETEPAPSDGPGDPNFEVVRALSELHNVAWSPDGRQLAFMGAMNGPTSDLYLFSLVSGDIVQLTDGPSQGIRPTWSLDGAYIVHAGVGTLGTGAGYGLEGIWAAKSDNSDVITLYPIPEGSGDEGVLGWVSPSKFIAYTWNAVCGLNNLRVYDLETGQTEVLWQDFFSNVAFSPESGTALISVDEWTADCNPGGNDAMVLLEPGQGAPLQVLDLGSARFDWVPSAGVFLARSDAKMFAVWPEGETRRLVDAPGAELPAVSPDGRMWAFAESTQGGAPGLWLGAFGDETDRIFTGNSRHVTWSPGGEGFFFFGDEGLYFAVAPSFESSLIGPGLKVIQSGPTNWVWP